MTGGGISVKIRNLTFCALFAALLIVSAFLKIPLGVISLTFQLQLCLLGAFIIGEKFAALSVFIYLLAGFLGIPVFTMGGGISYFLRPTAGYLLALIPCAFLTGIMCRIKAQKKLSSFYLCFVPGILTVDILGGIYCLIITAFHTDTAVISLPLILSVFVIPLAKDLLINLPFSYLCKKLLPLRTSKQANPRR